MEEMTSELSSLPHFTSTFQKSEGSPSDVPPAKDKMDLDNFPPEVKRHILDHLSYKQIAQLRSLSKGWNSTSGEWQEPPPLTFLPSNCDPDPDLFKDFLVCANEGLVCMNLPKLTHEERLIVFNPLTQQWKEIPPLLHPWNPVLMHMYMDQSSKSFHLYPWNPVLMHMYMDQSSKSFHLYPESRNYFILELGSGSECGISWASFHSTMEGASSVAPSVEPCFDAHVYGSVLKIIPFIQNHGIILFSNWAVGASVGSPGPAFALNEYQSGVFHLVNIFCIGFVELGDQTVKGILGYNVEEGLWSTKWSAEALPNSAILQLVESDGQLYLFSEQELCAVIEQWVDRIDWTPSEGDSEEKTHTFVLVNVLKKIKSGGRSLEVYPEYCCRGVSFICNTINRSGVVFDIGDEEKCEALPALSEGFQVLILLLLIILGQNLWYFQCCMTRARMSAASSFGNLLSNLRRSFGCSTLRLVGFLSCLNCVVGASPASAPRSSSSQMSSPYSTFFYAGIAATIIGTAIGVISLGVSLYYHKHERRDSVRGVLDVLTRSFREHQRCVCILVGNLKVGEASMDDLRLEFSV